MYHVTMVLAVSDIILLVVCVIRRKEGKKEEGKKEGKKEGAKMLTQLKGRHIFTIFLTYGLCKESP